jgi:hypothetical protein
VKWLIPLAFSLAGATGIARADTPATWLDPAPSSVPSIMNLETVPHQLFTEVPQDKRAAAVTALKNAASVPGRADFGGDRFACPAPLSPYLIRALYGNNGIGTYDLYWAGSSLIVGHASLGSRVKPQASALVACLAKAPSAVYSSVTSVL